VIRRWTTAAPLQAPIRVQMIWISTATQSHSQTHPSRWNLLRATVVLRAARRTSFSRELFQVGRDKTVIGVVKDPVGLVGCVVMVPWPSKASRCVVDAYASDAPDGAAYIISWVSKRDEHHLLPVARMASLGAQCAADVKSKLEGARMPLAADGTLG